MATVTTGILIVSLLLQQFLPIYLATRPTTVLEKLNPQGYRQQTETTPTPDSSDPLIQRGLPGYHQQTPLPQIGKAMYYASGVMERVIKYRLHVGDITPGKECLAYVALMRKGDLDREVWIVINGHAEGPFCVVDVAALQHIPSLLERNWVVDVDYQTAKRWGMVGIGPKYVVVLGAPSPTKQ